MSHIRSSILFATAVLLFTASLAFAAREEANYFSAEVPKGWKFSQEGALAGFYAPDPGPFITIITDEYENVDMAELVAQRAGENPVQLLGDELGFIFEDQSGERVWGMLADGGLYCEVSTSAKYDGLAQFLASLKSDGKTPGMDQAIKAAQSPEVLNWLQFTTPSFAGQGGPEETESETEGQADQAGVLSGTGLTAEIPNGWKVTEEGDTVLFTAADGSVSLSAQLLPLESDDYDAFVAFSKKHAKGLGGKNIRTAEGTVEFTMPDGSTGNMSQYGKTCLLLFFFGESDEQQVLGASIRPE